MNTLGILTAATLALLAGTVARADDATPVGTWTTIDDATGKPRSTVRIWEADGTLQGRIESVAPEPGKDPVPRCTRCEGDRKNQPIVGMVILWGLSRDGARWTGGHILDPDSGTIYRCALRPVQGGERLEVRGFVGLSLLGRTQTWVRAR